MLAATASAGLLESGVEVREYRVERMLGEGGMGAVYLAVHTLTGEQVAIKVVASELMRDEGVKRRFIEEARVMSALDHPSIVGLRTFFEEAGRFFLVMKYVEGESLEDCIDRTGPMPVDDAVRVSIAVLSALEYAHTRPQPVVHRDIKPANIMLGKDGSVVVMDFGIAKALGREKLTRAGGVVGTYEYMSPEQIRGDEVAPASDIYAFGITLYKMLAGVVPFAQTSDSGIECMNAHLKNRPPSVPEFREGIPRWLESVLERALAKEPRERFGNAAEMSAALAAASAGSPPVTPVSSQAVSRETVGRRDHEVFPPSSPRTGLWVGLGVGLLAVVVVALVFAFGSGKDGKPPRSGKVAAVGSKEGWKTPSEPRKEEAAGTAHDDEARRNREESERVREAKRQAEESSRLAEERERQAEEEMRKARAEESKLAKERQELEEQKRLAEEERRKAQAALARAEAERRLAESQRLEEERRRAEAEAAAARKREAPPVASGYEHMNWCSYSKVGCTPQSERVSYDVSYQSGEVYKMRRAGKYRQAACRAWHYLENVTSLSNLRKGRLNYELGRCWDALGCQGNACYYIRESLRVRPRSERGFEITCETCAKWNCPYCPGCY